MVSVETAPLPEGSAGSCLAEEAKTVGWKASAIAGDIATLGAGTALAAAFNTLLVFLIPRVMRVEDFGYWRLFMLYAGYAGLLQMGFLDGVLLRWAGRPLEAFHPEVRLSLEFLFWQQAALVVPASAIAWWTLRTDARFIGLAVLAYALLFNVNALLQYSLQAARQFKPVAFAAAVPAGAFVLLTFAWNLRGAPSFRVLIAFYCVGWAGALLYLWTRVRPLQSSPGWVSAWSFGKMCMLLGWPVVLANVGLGVVQSADRLVVSSALPIYEFAQYSLASSAMFVPVTAIAAVYRVFFPHVAAMEHEGRAKIYAHASSFLLLAWSLLLPYFFVLKVLIQRFLPRYLMALSAAGVLLLGVFFLAEIQILHMSFAYLYGRQRRFLLLTVGALLVSLTVGFVTAIWLRSLVAVAVGQVGALALWWLANEWSFRETTGHGWRDRLRPLAAFAWSAISYGVTIRYIENVGARIIVYYALVVGCLVLTCYPEIKIVIKLLYRALPQSATCL